MSGRLRVELDPGPIEGAGADVAFVGLRADERPLRGLAGRADWRLCGRLSALVAAGHLSGARGDAALLASGGGLRAPLLVALGLGPAGALDDSGREALGAEVVARALALGAESAVWDFPVVPLEGRERPQPGVREDDTAALAARARALLGGAARVLAESDARLRLRLVVCGDAGRAAAALRAARPRLPETLDLGLPGSRARTPTPGLRASY